MKDNSDGKWVLRVRARMLNAVVVVGEVVRMVSIKARPLLAGGACYEKDFAGYDFAPLMRW